MYDTKFVSTRLKPTVWLLAMLSETWPSARLWELRPPIAVVSEPNKDMAELREGGATGAPVHPPCQRTPPARRAALAERPADRAARAAWIAGRGALWPGPDHARTAAH